MSATSFEQIVASSRIKPGMVVMTDYGQGVVTDATDRSVSIQLDAGDRFNVQRGTFGYERLKIVG